MIPRLKAVNLFAQFARPTAGRCGLTSISNMASGGAPTAAENGGRAVASGGREPMMITMMAATV